MLTHIDAMVPLINVKSKPTMNIVGFADSGFPQETSAFNAAFPFLLSTSGHNGSAMVNPACKASTLSLLRCLQPAASAHLLESPVFVFNSRYDESDMINPAQLTQFPHCAMPSPRPSSCNACITAYGQKLTEAIEREIITRPAAGVAKNTKAAAFIDSCSRHCGSESGPLQIGGVTAYQAFAEWYRGGARNLWVQQHGTAGGNTSYPCKTCCG